MPTDPATAGTAPGVSLARVAAGVRALRPPVREPRFWLVQVAVVSLALIHDVVLVVLDEDTLAGVPAPITSSLLLIPVIYAALNFGVRGAVATALWATALIVPHWFLVGDITEVHLSIEIAYLVVLNVVALVVGRRVESEQRARRRAEVALDVSEVATARYQALFEELPAPVIITDRAGIVTEMNGSATELLGFGAGRPITELLPCRLEQILEGCHDSLSLPTTSGETRHFEAHAHPLDLQAPLRLVQVILTDVTDAQRRHDEQRRFSRRLLTVQEEERRSLARELHDDPLQNLTYLARTVDDIAHDPALSAENATRLERSSAVAGEAAAGPRKVIHGLRPPVLDDLGLVSALRQLVEQTRSRSGLSIDLSIEGTEIRLPPPLALAAYRIAQEALTNVVRHAHADRARLQVQFGELLVITSQRPLRLAEFDDLFATAVRSVERRGADVRIHLSGEDGLLDRVRDLADRESSCCSFFTFTIDGTGEDLTLDISVPPARQEILDAMAARAEELSA